MRIESVTNAVTKAAYFTTDVAGALGGMTAGVVIGGVRGGVNGAVEGVREGIEKGSESTVTSAVTMAAIGATGVIGWPIVAAVGGPALAVRMLRPRPGSEQPQDPAVDEAPETKKAVTTAPARRRRSPRSTPRSGAGRR